MTEPEQEEEDPIIGIIRRALVTAERSFSFRAGQGHVQPGDYLTDADKAKAIVAALDEEGYVITPSG